MKHQPVDPETSIPDKPVADITDAEFEAWMNALPPCPGLPSTPEDIAAADAAAEADIAAGRVVPHEQVAKWLSTWGTPEFKPMPREWLE